MIAMIPFAFTSVISIHTAYYLAVVVGLVELFGLGVFLGSISRERLWFSGLKLVFAGVIALVISLCSAEASGDAGRPDRRARPSTRCSPASTRSSARP